MKPIEYLYDLVGQSNFTTIGYTFQDGNLKDEFISKLPFIRYKEIDSSFSFDGTIKQKIRDIRLDSILNDSSDIGKPGYLILDYDDLPSHLDNYLDGIPRSIELSKLLENLRTHGIVSDVKIIFTTPTYNSLELVPSQKLKGGIKSIYISDLVFMIGDGVAKIEKNKFSHGHFNETVSLNRL
jgi:hypothetical protein